MPSTKTNSNGGVRPLIITRHQGLVMWLESHGIRGEVISHLSNPSEIKDRDIYGIFPIHIAEALLQNGNKVHLCTLPDLPPEMRGKELTPAEMDHAGAKVKILKAIQLEDLF